MVARALVWLNMLTSENNAYLACQKESSVTVFFFYSRFNQRCMDFVRSMPAIRPECNLGPREQMNQITAFLDAR